MSDAKPLTVEHIQRVLADPDPLVNRLRGKYTTPVGERQFPTTPIQVAAAVEIDALRARAEQAEADASWWKELGTRLWSSAAEQQHTLASLGWDDSDSRIGPWSKAGARHYQYETLESAIRDFGAALDGTVNPDHFLRRVHGIFEVARLACRVGHSKGCGCYCCKVVQMIDASAALARAGEVKP